MSVPADRELLLAVLALQEGLVSREALVAALNDWADDTSRPLGDVLVARDLLGEGERAMLQMAVARRIEQDGDPVSSLAALEAGPVLGELSTRIGNADLAAGLTSRLTDLARLPGSVGKRVGQTSAESGRFRILRSHAAGGLGEVFLAHDEELDREVAVKEIRAEYVSHADICSRFFLEAEITGGLEHPGVVPVYGLGRGEDGRPFYAMQFVRGETLNEAIARFHAEPKGKPDARSWNLGLRRLLGHFVAVCNTLAYAHSRGVIHRDIKPQNILLGPYGETLLVDWGLAKIVGRDEQAQRQEDETAGRREATETLRPEAAAGSTPTMFGTAVGTLAFMSPEQAAGLVDQLGPPCDIYGLGATLYMLLTGRIPFPNKELQQTRQDIIAGRCVPPRQGERPCAAGPGGDLPESDGHRHGSPLSVRQGVGRGDRSLAGRRAGSRVARAVERPRRPLVAAAPAAGRGSHCGDGCGPRQPRDRPALADGGCTSGLKRLKNWLNYEAGNRVETFNWRGPPWTGN